MKKILVSILITGYAILIPTLLHACTCTDPIFPGSNVGAYEFVIAGRILSYDVFPVRDKKGGEFLLSKSKLLVDNRYKGKTSNDTLTIYSAWNEGTCGYTFKQYGKYVVYGDREAGFKDIIADTSQLEGDNIIWTWFCSGTTKYTDEEDKAVRRVISVLKK